MKQDDRLSSLNMLDEVGHRKFIVPVEVKGFFRKTRTLFFAFLTFIFLAAPWSSWDGVQTIWLDISTRRFVLFGNIFLAHEVPLLFFILILTVMTLVILATVFGRVWCGWACPQTVFIDFVYRQIEIWTEGTAIQRRRLNASDWTVEKLTRKSIKWVLFILVSVLISHSFLAYFVGKEKLLAMMARAPEENITYFVIASFLTSLFAFNFGWFREQFCVIMCPYGRFQSLMMDANSRTVRYDLSRGEPRRTIGSGTGDCVDCKMCVQACPTGIDIRAGLQMECIGCTACIDACDTIMDKVHKPRGLIRYGSEDNQKIQFLRARFLAYLGIFIILLGGFVLLLRNKTDYFVEILRQKGVPYLVLPSGEIQNQFYIRLINQTTAPQTYSMTISNPDQIELVYPEEKKLIYPQEDIKIPLFIRIKPSFPRNSGNNVRTELHFHLGKTEVNKELTLIIPQQEQL